MCFIIHDLLHHDIEHSDDKVHATSVQHSTVRGEKYVGI